MPFTHINSDSQICFAAVSIDVAYTSDNSSGLCMWGACNPDNTWFIGMNELWIARK